MHIYIERKKNTSNEATALCAYSSSTTLLSTCLLPVLKSLLDVQQHPIPACTMNPHKLNPEASHIKTNILVPTEAWMFSSLCAVAAILKAMLITVPKIEPPTISIVEQNKATKPRGKLLQRESTPKGVTKIMMKLITVPVMKKPNMTWDEIRKTSRMVMTAVGRAMVAPAKSSFMITSTGLNQ